MASEARLTVREAGSLGRPGLADYSVYGLFLLTGPILYFAENAVQAVVPLAALAIYLRRPPTWAGDVKPYFRRHAAVFGIGVLGIASAMWSLDPEISFWRGARLLPELGIGLAFLAHVRSLDGDARGRCMVALALGFAAAAAAVLIDLGFQWLMSETTPLYRFYLSGAVFSQGISIQAMLALPLTLGLWRRRERLWAWVFAVATLCALVLVNNAAARFATVCGLLAFALVYALPTARYVVYGVVVAAFLSMPMIFPISLESQAGCALFKTSASAAHRIAIWNVVDERISERPLLGWGLDTSRVLSQRQGTIDLSTVCPKGDIKWRPGLVKARLPLHPHNAPLQLWLELGALGAYFVAGLMFMTLLRLDPALAGRLSPAGLCGALGALMAVLLLSYGMLQGWLLASLFVFVGVLTMFLDIRPARS